MSIKHIYLVFSLYLSLFCSIQPQTMFMLGFFVMQLTDLVSGMQEGWPLVVLLTHCKQRVALLVCFEFEETLHHLCVQHVLCDAVCLAWLGSSSKTSTCFQPLSVFPYQSQMGETHNQATPWNHRHLRIKNCWRIFSIWAIPHTVGDELHVTLVSNIELNNLG